MVGLCNYSIFVQILFCIPSLFNPTATFCFDFYNFFIFRKLKFHIGILRQFFTPLQVEVSFYVILTKFVCSKLCHFIISIIFILFFYYAIFYLLFLSFFNYFKFMFSIPFCEGYLFKTTRITIYYTTLTTFPKCFSFE